MRIYPIKWLAATTPNNWKNNSFNINTQTAIIRALVKIKYSFVKSIHHLGRRVKIYGEIWLQVEQHVVLMFPSHFDLWPLKSKGGGRRKVNKKGHGNIAHAINHDTRVCFLIFFCCFFFQNKNDKKKFLNSARARIKILRQPKESAGDPHRVCDPLCVYFTFPIV